MTFLLMCFFYTLFSEQLNRYYFGHTCDAIEGRIREHLYEHSSFTGKVKDWKLVYLETYGTKAEAYARERQVKKWKNRKLIERIIYHNKDD